MSDLWGGDPGWDEDVGYGQVWPPLPDAPGRVDRLVIADQRTGTILATIPMGDGYTQADAVAALTRLDEAFAMLPAGAHPIPVN